MNPTHILLGLQILIGCQFKIRSSHLKIQKSGFSLVSQKIWPLLELSRDHSFSPGLALSKSPASSPLHELSDIRHLISALIGPIIIRFSIEVYLTRNILVSCVQHSNLMFVYITK